MLCTFTCKIRKQRYRLPRLERASGPLLCSSGPLLQPLQQSTDPKQQQKPIFIHTMRKCFTSFDLISTTYPSDHSSITSETSKRRMRKSVKISGPLYMTSLLLMRFFYDLFVLSVHSSLWPEDKCHFHSRLTRSLMSRASVR